ncbi:MAG: hypothetical protein IPJ49_19320 [Candidatus Obscuribacter sp.]|nr:hypothetical protein [Candidatus Obscuribacter sp.]
MNTNTNIILASAGLPISFAGIINQFCLTSVKDTGWTWGDAIETSLDSGADIDFDLTPLGRFPVLAGQGRRRFHLAPGHRRVARRRSRGQPRRPAHRSFRRCTCSPRQE